MRSFSVLDYLIEDRVFFLFKFSISNIGSGQSCWPSIQSLFLMSILATRIRSHSLLSPVYQGHDGIIKHSSDPWIGDFAQIILDFAFRQAVIHAAQKISNSIIFTLLVQSSFSFLFCLCRLLETGFLVPALFGSRLHLLSEGCALVWGMFVRGCAHRDLC